MNVTESIRRYYEQLQPKYITWEFYEKYIDVEPPFGQLGLVVFLRTYSRYIKDLGRREKFCEVCLRVVEYSLSLDNITSVEKKKEEATLLYDDLFNLRSLCAGRTLWVANTKITAKDPSANFNCTASTIKDLTSIVEGFYLLLVGAGFGFSVEKKYIEKLPKFYRSKQVTHKDYTGWVKGFDDTVLFTDESFELTFKPVVESKDNAFADYYGFNEVKHVIITVGDSKEGWVMALKSYLAALTSPTVQTITFDYNWVRPEGELLKTFGGRSSGYKALQQLFDDIYTVTQELDSDDGQQLNSAQVMDLVNAVGLAVVVGGVRRCLPQNTLVHLDKGLTPIKDVQIGDMVKTAKGLYPVTNVFYQGEQELVTIRTQIGELKCTPNHRVAVINDVHSNYIFKQASELLPNDRMVFVTDVTQGTVTDLPKFTYVKPKHATTCKNITVPNLDNDIAYLLGYIHGNGYVKVVNTDKGYSGGEISIAIHSSQIDTKDKLINILSRFNVNPRLQMPSAREDCFKVRVKSKQLALYLSQFKLPNTTMVVPDFILNGTLNIRKNYLAGLTDADGSFKNTNVNLVTSIYPEYLKQVQCLYASLGYPTKLKLHREAQDNWKALYILSLNGKQFVDKYDEEFFNLINKFEARRNLTKSHHGFGYPSEFVVNSTLNWYEYWDSNCEQLTIDCYSRITGVTPTLIPIRVLSVEYDHEIDETYDIEVDGVNEFVCGGGYLVHNSSQLVLADEDDKLIRDAKKNLWSDPALENKRRTRVMSNNSLALYDNPGLEWFQTVIDSVKTTGEPGFISVGNANKKDPTGSRKVFNPCFAAGTMVMTREGHYPIEELVGKTVEVHDGEQWVEINNFRVTGENQEVWKVIFHNGQELTATPYHTFILENGERVQLRDLTIGQKLKSVDTTVEGGIQVSAAYIKGFLLGNGTHIEDRPLLSLYEPKYQCETRLLNSASELPIVSNRTNTVATLGFEDATAGRQSRKRMTGLTARNDGDLLNYVTTYREHLPKDIYNWNLESKCQFLAGLFDADGTVMNTKHGYGYQLSNVNLTFLQDVQLLLLTIGVHSKLALMRKKGVSDFGKGGVYEAKDCYRLTISQKSSITLANQVTFSRLMSFANNTVTYTLKNKAFKIVNIEQVGVVDKVYCCTVPTNNSFTLSNGLHVGQCAEILLDDKGVCNLTEVYLPKHIKEDGRINYVTLERSLGLATRMGSRITLVEMFHKDWNAVQKRDRLLGVSLSGVVDFFDLVGINTPEAESKFYAWCKKIVHNVADTYHDELGIPKSLLKTTIKPSGTLSTLVGCGSGIHRSYAPYYYRRVRVSVNDPIAMALKDIGVPVNPENGQGETINDDGVNTWVFTFPVKTDTKIKAIDESAITQLERYRNAQVNYVDHNVSFTCSVDIDEWDDVATWLYENYDDFIGVSFLPKFDSTNSPYPQLPYEVCEKEQYEELKKDIPSMSENDFLQVLQNYEKLEDEYEILEDACGGKGCPLR